jgi:hypothetical protein
MLREEGNARFVALVGGNLHIISKSGVPGNLLINNKLPQHVRCWLRSYDWSNKFCYFYEVLYYV